MQFSYCKPRDKDNRRYTKWVLSKEWQLSAGIDVYTCSYINRLDLGQQYPMHAAESTYGLFPLLTKTKLS